jgi:excisionase family DNA binding protein/YgiT-type zinc finger domain-containing protein
MKCFNCDADMVVRTVNVKTGWGKYDIQINGVEAYVCENCGSEIYEPEEARMIQNIARGYADSAISEKPDILTVEEVSDLLKVTSQTIYNMIKDNRLIASKIGREWRFRRFDIEQLLEQSRPIITAKGGEVAPKRL